MSKEGEHTTHKVEVTAFPGASEAVKQLAKPVYEDGVKPAVIETGKVLQTTAASVNALLMPLRVGIFAFEQIEQILKDGVTRRLSSWSSKEADMRTPPTNVAVPAIEALRYHASIEELREMFLNLIASTMDGARADLIHPAFVEIIKQLSSDEARMLTLFFGLTPLEFWSFEAKWHVPPSGDGKGGYFRTGPTFYRLTLIGKDAGCEMPARVPAYADNLLRLGLVYRPRPWASHARSVAELRDPKPDSTHPSGKVYYHSGERIGELVDDNSELERVAEKFGSSDSFEIWREELKLTEFGKAFCLSCVMPENDGKMISFGASDEQLLNNKIVVG